MTIRARGFRSVLIAAIMLAGWVMTSSAVDTAQVPQSLQGRQGREGLAGRPGVPPRKKLLAIGDTHTGFTHDSIGHALATIDRLGHESGLFDTYIRTDFDAVFLLAIQWAMGVTPGDATLKSAPPARANQPSAPPQAGQR